MALTIAPEVGDGVVVPWGLDEVEGEVIEVINPSRVVVAVPVEGASGETLDTMRASYDLEVLGEVTPWTITKITQGYPAAGADATKAWYIDATRSGEIARVEVRVAGSAEASRSLPAESRRAIQSRGKTAFEKFARRLRLPKVIVVGSAGVFAASS